MVTKSFLKEASINDVDVIVTFLEEMQRELNELKLNPHAVKKSITNAMNENVHWFLFLDETNGAFGTCHLQSVHNYWRVERRYLLGGFYIKPPHRGKGRFRDINNQLKEWATKHDGVQIYAHIHKDNAKSLGAFSSVGMNVTEYTYCADHWGD